jgi:hypothetical protein
MRSLGGGSGKRKLGSGKRTANPAGDTIDQRREGTAKGMDSATGKGSTKGSSKPLQVARPLNAPPKDRSGSMPALKIDTGSGKSNGAKPKSPSGVGSKTGKSGPLPAISTSTSSKKMPVVKSPAAIPLASIPVLAWIGGGIALAVVLLGIVLAVALSGGKPPAKKVRDTSLLLPQAANHSHCARARRRTSDQPLIVTRAPSAPTPRS